MTLIELDELGPGVALRLTPEQGRALAASGVVTATPSAYEPGLWQVSPGGKVGAAKVGDAEIHIRSKVEIGRLLFLAGYSKRGVTWQAEAVQIPEADDLVPAIAEALWRQTERAIHQGLLPGYIVIEESSLVVRGRLRETEQLHRHHGLPLPLETRHDEFTTDISENRILATACQRMLTVPRVTPQSQQMLRRLLHVFADITPLRPGDPIPAWQATRLNTRYHAALYLAELVLRATSVEHGSGNLIANGFLIDMPRLFEDFVTMALREAIVPIYGGRVCGQDWNHFDEAGRVTLRPDIVWRVRGAPMAVIDAKYKAEQPAGYPNADLYQMLAYCTVLKLPRGHLIYAKGAGEAVTYTVREAGIEIISHALDLDAEPASLLGQIGDLAGAVAGAGVPT